MRILLLGAGGNAGINFTKSVQKAGHTVVGIDLSDYYLDSSNADIKERIDYSDKTNYILHLIGKHDIDLVHAQPDPEVEYLLSTPELSSYIFPHSLEKWKKFSNKLYCQSVWAKEVKLFVVYSYADVMKLPYKFGELLYRGGGKVWIRATQGAGSKAALPVNTLEQASNWTSYWREMRGMKETDFMFCQYLPGKEYAVQTFWYNGTLVHAQARERVIYFFGALMPSGQTSTPAVARTISDERIYDAAYKAIKAIDPTPHGIYCVDLKEDIEGDPIPTEVNYGRFFTTVDFFTALNINTPDEYLRSMKEPYIPDYRINQAIANYYWVRGLDKEPKLLKYEPKMKWGEDLYGKYKLDKTDL